MPRADLPAWTAAIPFIRTMLPIAAHHRRDANLCGRYSGTSLASILLTWSVVGICRDRARLQTPCAQDYCSGDHGRVEEEAGGAPALAAP